MCEGSVVLNLVGVEAGVGVNWKIYIIENWNGFAAD